MTKRVPPNPFVPVGGEKAHASDESFVAPEFHGVDHASDPDETAVALLAPDGEMHPPTQEEIQAQMDQHAREVEAAFAIQRDETFAAVANRRPQEYRKTNVATSKPPSEGGNPFTYKAPAPKAPEVEPFPEPEGLPSWAVFVKFVQDHREIIQARYPNPRGACIDTIFQGVPVFNHPTVEYRHVKHGWVPHDQATSTE